MKSRIFGFVRPALMVVGLVALAAAGVFAQEGEPVVVDEVIAQVNNDIITLSMVRREMKEAIEARKAQGATEQQATEEITRRRPELIATLINEQLLLQKGKDLDLTNDIETEVNKRLLELMKQQGCKTIECLDEAMKAGGVDPADFRQTARKEIMKSAVLQREVDAKIYYNLTPDELKKYYEAHKDQFHKAESVDLSDIFLSLAGRTDADLNARATKIVAQARAGADFGALAVANSEQEENGKRVAAETKGKVGRFQVPDLRADFAAAIKDLKVGGISDPIRTDEGYYILRVDDRSAASNASTYVEDQVRQAMTAERAQKERDAYLRKLREDAYIQIAKDYKDSVQPLLSLQTTASNEKAAAPATPAGANKKSSGKESKKP